MNGVLHCINLVKESSTAFVFCRCFMDNSCLHSVPTFFRVTSAPLVHLRIVAFPFESVIFRAHFTFTGVIHDVHVIKREPNLILSI